MLADSTLVSPSLQRWLLGCCLGLLWTAQACATQTALQNAAIASAHPLATAAGKRILEQGGNAFDAAIAVAAALAVVEPYSSGLGGGGFFLLQRARDGKTIMLDARERAPAAARFDMYLDRQGEVIPQSSLQGPRAAAIPGVPAGLAHLARRYGRLSLAKSLAPAIALAENGFPADARYRALAQNRLHQLQAQPEASAQYLHAGKVPDTDSRIVQPRLAWTLRLLAEQGAAGFYRGKVAREMVAAVRQAGGIWQLQDLAQYRVIERKPIHFQYRGMDIYSAAPPSAGGITLAQTLHMLEPYDLGKMEAPRRMHLVAEALRRAYHDRARYLGDPDYVRMPIKRLLSASYAAQRTENIDPDNVTPSASLGDAPVSRQGPNTTHFSIVDRQGNRVAATLSINTFFGSGFVAGKTGVLLNNEMDDFAIAARGTNIYSLVHASPNRIVPGKRPLSSMSPTFVDDARGTLILGAPGGSRIPSMLVLAILQYQMKKTVDLPAILRAPRFHHQYLPDQLEVEPDAFPPAVLDELQLIGHVLRVNERQWGNMQMVWVDRASGHAYAASDPRGMGSGFGWY